MKKRVVSLLLAFCLCVTLLPAAALAYSTGDDYPAEYKNAEADTVTDRWNFYNRECTSFVAWCLNSRNGVSFTNWYGGIRWGHAKDWAEAARSLGIPVDMDPAVGAVAWWDTGAYGHVAWVQAVSGDSVTIEEYNAWPNQYAYQTRTISRSSADGFIHVQDIAPSQPSGIEYAEIELKNYFIKNNGTGRYLCVSQSGEGDNIMVWDRSGYTYEFEMAVVNAPSGYRLKPTCTSGDNRYVNVWADAVAHGDNVNLYQDVGDETQWWGFQPVSGGYVIRNLQDTNLCLGIDSDGYNVKVFTYTGAPDQVWSLEPSPIPVSGITLDRANAALQTGQQLTLTATVVPDSATDRSVSWSSSDTAVATVKNGRVTAKAVGTAVITATTSDGGKTAACTVTVTAAPPVEPDLDCQETERNDTIVTADAVMLNTEISGVISSSSDKDWFRFTLPSKGSVAISFRHDYLDIASNCWRTSLYTEANERISSTSWPGNDTVEKTSGRYGLEAGTYFLCVEGTAPSIRDNAYQFAVEFTRSENWEAEFNDTIVTANRIFSDQTYSGSIMQYGDRDWYRFTLPAAGTVQLSFGHEYIDTSFPCWRTSIYTAANQEVSRTSWKGNATVTEVFEETGLPAGDYYLCVEGADSGAYGLSYWFSVQSTAGSSGAGDSATQFTDVPADSYYAKPIKWAAESGVAKGTSATKFSPEDICTNAQILTFIWRAAGWPEPVIANPFTNLSGSEYYAKAAVWAYENGMVSGTVFDANRACTRAMTVEYLWKQAGSPIPPASGKFTDVPADYTKAVAWAVYNGITNGTSDTTFSPDRICTRGQIVTFLYRAVT